MTASPPPPALQTAGLTKRFGDTRAVDGLDLTVPRGRKAARARAGDLLDAFGLADRAGRLVKTFSGGMRRRLDVAASLIVTPELLFLDEPTTGLDPAARALVWDVIAMLPAHGTTVLLTTQYLDEADRLADRLAVIDHGRLIAEGTPGQLRAATGSGVLRLHLDDPSRRDDAARLVDRPSVGATDPAVLTFAGIRPWEANAVLAELLAGGITLSGFSLDRPSLEEAFLTLTASTTEPDLGSSR
ncbi:ATP-binding cassette domain-containing protein [Spirillospora sp. NPDC052269]